MLKGIYTSIQGFEVWKISACDATCFFELCRRRGLLYDRVRNLAGGGISLRLTLYTAGKLLPLCRDAGICPTVTRRAGLPILAGKLLKRPGLVLGGILGIILLISAQSVVWDIRISGNETVSDKAIIDTLASVGLSVGTPLRGFRADVAENEALLADERLAWISVNRKGTVAYVEVKEARDPTPLPSEEPCNLVASMGGVIDRIELESGNVQIFAGQIVGKGDLLVSGIYDSATVGLRLTAARGRVFARTVRVFTTRIPLSYTQKTYDIPADGEDGEICVEKSINFFGRNIKFSKNYGNMEGFYDIIEDEKSWGILPSAGFPISTQTRWYVPYTEADFTRTYPEAEELAYFELQRYLSSLPGGAEVLNKTVTTRLAPDALYLTCTITCIEDIAERRVIEVEE